MKPYLSINSCSIIFCILFLIFFEMVVNSHALGTEEEQNVVNYSYISELGVGGANTDNQTVRAIQVPFSYQLRPMTEEQWGIKLLFPVTFGVVGFDVLDAIGNLISLDVSVLSVVPGVDVASLVRAIIIPFKIKGEIPSKASKGTEFEIPGEVSLRSFGGIE